MWASQRLEGFHSGLDLRESIVASESSATPAARHCRDVGQ